MADALGNSIILVSLPLFFTQLPSPIHFSKPESPLIGILISLYGLAFSALQPLTGAVSDQMSRCRPSIAWGLVVMGLGTLADVIVARAIEIAFIPLVQSIGVALTVPAALASMAISGERGTRGGWMETYTGFRMVGFALGPLQCGYLQVAYGFCAVFISGSSFLGRASGGDRRGCGELLHRVAFLARRVSVRRRRVDRLSPRAGIHPPGAADHPGVAPNFIRRLIADPDTSCDQRVSR